MLDFSSVWVMAGLLVLVILVILLRHAWDSAHMLTAPAARRRSVGEHGAAF